MKIQDRDEHKQALIEVDRLMDAEADTPDAKRLSELVDAIVEFEEREYPEWTPAAIAERHAAAMADAARVAGELEASGDYERVRVLPDASVAALGQLLYTKAIHLGCTRGGWTRRYCFEDHALANARFDELMSEDDDPQGYIASRPKHG
jgi:hypothetical protein